jgi:putative ABC transport system permease protein
VRTLDRKLVRDLRHLRGQMLSIGGVVACGIAAVVAMGSTLQTIQHARTEYYEQARFAHVFASLKRAPESMARRLAAIPGVAAVETRVTASVLLDVPGLTEPATGWVVSIPTDRPQVLNRLHVRRGRWPAAGVSDEVLLGEHFADANRLGVGDTLAAVINGRWRRLTIVGVAISPEFVHDVAAGFHLFSDSRHFGVLWMGRDALGPLYGMDGAFNDVTVALAPGANEDDVIDRLDAILSPHGGGRAYGRDDQPSNNVVTGEIKQLRAFGIVMPAVFLFVAAFLVSIVLSRLVSTQRGEIATLKAFGYTNRAVAGHFLGYALVALALGAVVGIPFGAWVGSKYTALYQPFFRFPAFEHHTSIGLVVLSVAVAGGSAVVGALSAVRSAAALPPAEGMRPPTPPIFRPLLLERLGFVGAFSPTVRMVLRSLERRPWRAAASIVGVSLAVGTFVGGTFAFDVAMYMGDLQFRVVEREDLAVGFTTPLPARTRHELRAVPGVARVEMYRSVPVRLVHGHRFRQMAITGLEREATLRRLVDGDGRIYPIPPGGVVLTTTLGAALDIERGDTVRVELLERGGAERRVVVTALLDELLGIAGYMEIGELNRLVGEGPVVSGAYLALEPGGEARALAVLRRLPGVAGATPRRAMLESFEEQITSMITLTTTIVALLACVIAVGVLYNGARIALSERGRDLASLRVIGFTKREVAGMLLGEQGAVNLAGTPLGLLLGLGLAWLIAFAFKSELYRFPVIVTARTYLWGVVMVIVAGAAAGIAMRRRLNALDLIAVLKTRE